ncbi:MAG: isoaspartyl peptidase/L-asparaginase [Pseudomonadota bacterium]
MAEEWAIIVHGGADATPRRDYKHVEVHLQGLMVQASGWLNEGMSALDAAQKAVTELEACGHHIAGKGASPNMNGIWELDAAIMDGPSRNAGAVSALVGFLSPIGVARSVMEHTPNVLLSGEGAVELGDRYKHEKVLDPMSYYDPSVKEKLPPNAAGHGTVGAVVLDKEGNLAAATSTGGLLNKTPGRVGDSPIIGAGTWADQDVAVSCTGEGEYFMRVAAAASVAARVRYGGETVEEGSAHVIEEVGGLGGKGGLIALGKNGEIAMPYNSKGMKRACATSSGRLEVKIFE